MACLPSVRFDFSSTLIVLFAASSVINIYRHAGSTTISIKVHFDPILFVKNAILDVVVKPSYVSTLV